MNEVESGISDSVVSKQQVRDSPQSDDKLVKTRRASKRTVNAKDEKLDVVIDEVGRRRSRAVTRVGIVQNFCHRALFLRPPSTTLLMLY